MATRNAMAAVWIASARTRARLGFLCGLYTIWTIACVSSPYSSPRTARAWSGSVGHPGYWAIARSSSVRISARIVAASSLAVGAGSISEHADIAEDRTEWGSEDSDTFQNHQHSNRIINRMDQLHTIGNPSDDTSENGGEENKHIRGVHIAYYRLEDGECVRVRRVEFDNENIIGLVGII